MENLLNELREAFGFTEATISLIRRGGDGNQTFRVEQNGTPYVARIYGTQGQDHPEWVRYEVELLRYLSEQGISLSVPVARRDQKPFGMVEEAPFVLFTFADGGVEWPTRPENASLLGAKLAKLHRAGDTFATTASPRVFDLERLLWQPLQRMLAFVPANGDTARTLTGTAEQAAALIASIPDSGGAIGPIHGDIHQGNCHFQADGALTFFDFSNAGVGWRAYDFSGFLWPLRDDTIRDPAIRASCDSFLDGYRSVRPLLPEEESAIPAFVKARDFWETGNWLEFDKTVDPDVVVRGLNDLAAQFTRFPLH